MIVIQIEKKDKSVDVKSIEADQVEVIFKQPNESCLPNDGVKKEMDLVMGDIGSGKRSIDDEVTSYDMVMAVVKTNAMGGTLRAFIVNGTESMRVYLNGVLVAKASEPTETSHGKAFSRVGLDS